MWLQTQIAAHWVQLHWQNMLSCCRFMYGIFLKNTVHVHWHTYKRTHALVHVKHLSSDFTANISKQHIFLLRMEKGENVLWALRLGTSRPQWKSRWVHNPGKMERLRLWEHDSNGLAFPCFVFHIYLGVVVSTCWNMKVLSGPCVVLLVTFIFVWLLELNHQVKLGEVGTYKDTSVFLFWLPWTPFYKWVRISRFSRSTKQSWMWVMTFIC